MSTVDLKFTSSLQDAGSFKLMELPPDLCKLIEQSIESNTPTQWTVKGQSTDDAVLCTSTKTYALRSVVLSNSVLVVTRSEDADLMDSSDTVVIRDTLHEVLEPVVSVPKLQVLNGLLRGRVYDEGHEDVDEDVEMEEDDRRGSQSQTDGRPTRKRKFTYDDARETLQASQVELDRGLRERRVLIIDGTLLLCSPATIHSAVYSGELRPIAPSYLTTILELLLNYLVSLSLPHSAAPVSELTTSLEDDHEIKAKVSKQVMAWFGDVDDGLWVMDVKGVVREIGLGILRAYKDDPIPETDFMSKWKTAVGDTFEQSTSLDLLHGNFISIPPSESFSPTPLLSYFPSSSLPTDPFARFADLFLTRSRWKADDISPFLMDICVDNKERDKLLLKYARAITDKDGVWYTARAK
ncbi:sister chromatid cohesion protein Dcc1 [Cristinia sonorae]|uniref:Sister chromatid cohesion protein Dcc1 n=1 Tax=Cristinia sonorae TaxID=1940300 RepID=A0A8K0XMV1_9AGAR|nr:sister chromatid cohesion protein Dcc1 [Cristinia sonorae]